MTRRERFDFVIRYFENERPVAETELEYTNPYELLIAVILSAQCTDKRVNLTTPRLFAKYPDPQSLAYANPDEVFQIIRSISYPNSKTKYIIGSAKMLVEEFGGVVPADRKLLEKMPGVGRKTASVIASVVYDLPELPVDTHVFRVSARIGLTVRAKTPLQTERQLLKYLPKEKLGIAHHWLILHGRYICVARRPKCEICGLRPACLYFQKIISKDLRR